MENKFQIVIADRTPSDAMLVRFHMDTVDEFVERMRELADEVELAGSVTNGVVAWQKKKRRTNTEKN